MAVDYSKFTKALSKVLETTSREIPLVLNATMIEVITTAAKLTKKASPEVIESKLSTETVSVKVSKTGKSLKNARLYFAPTPMVYKIINAKQTRDGLPGLNNAQMSVAAQGFIRRRKRAIGYTAYAGWQKALQAVGGRGFGNASAKLGGSIDAGYGIKADSKRMIAEAINTASAIEIIGGEAAVQEAINMKTERMMQHLEEKMEKAAREFNSAK